LLVQARRRRSTCTVAALAASDTSALRGGLRLEDVEAVAVDHRGPEGVAATRCFSTGSSGFGDAALDAPPRSALTSALSRSDSAGPCEPATAADPARRAARPRTLPAVPAVRVAVCACLAGVPGAAGLVSVAFRRG